MRGYDDSAALLYCLLDLERSAVGVRLIGTAEEFARSEGICLRRPINYCQMIRAASRGTVIKADSSVFACRSGARVLGIDKTDEHNSGGENWARLGLYKNRELSREVRETLHYCRKDQYGVAVGPAETLGTVPDAVVLITRPYNIMRLVQGYAYHFGMPRSIQTMNAMEGDAQKEKIEKKRKDRGIRANIRYRYNYYMDC